MDAQEIMKRLQEPFPPEDIEWRVGSTNSDKTKGIALAYVTNRAIMNRLDSIFGPFGWKNEFREWKESSQLCGISVLWNGEWITKWDGADDSQTEAVKGGLSDAMKRAGYQWGIGRYLYNLENQWVPIEPAGRSFRLKSEPRLPKWALPEGYEYGKPQQTQQAHTEPPKNINQKLKLVGEIKTEWAKICAKNEILKMNHLDAQCIKSFGKKVSELSEDEATDFLKILRGEKEPA